VDWLKRIFGRTQAAELAPELARRKIELESGGIPRPMVRTDKQLLALGDRLFQEAGDKQSWRFLEDAPKAPAMAAIRELPRPQAARLALLLSRRLVGTAEADLAWRARGRGRIECTSMLVGLILRKKLEFEPDDVALLLDAVLPKAAWSIGHISGVVKVAERVPTPLPESVQAALDRMLERVPDGYHGSFQTVRRKAAQLAGHADADPIPAGLPWADVARRWRDAQPPEAQSAWNILLEHATSATAGKPSARWKKVAKQNLGAAGFDGFRDAVPAWFEAFAQPNPDIAEPEHTWQPGPYHVPNADLAILKGLGWYAGLHADAEIARALTKLCVAANRKIPGHGPRAQRVGNAAIWGLGNMPGLDAVGQLAVLRVRVKGRAAQKVISKAFDAAAEREGLPASEIEEMAVPSYGLTEPGFRREQLGDFRGELVVDERSRTVLRWFKPDGSPQKSVPAAVKRDFADELKELKAAAKDIDKLVSATKNRLDGLFLRREPWAMATWRERYLDHPLVGAIARRLIWVVGDRAGCWQDGALRDVAGAPIPLTDELTVCLWHPLGQDLADVVAWRERLDELQIVQPFKQAWREIYVLTPAEEQTDVYSNRFAAHLLRQHAMNALAAQRGWAYALHLMVDQGFPPATRSLPEWGLRAEFWVDGAGDQYGGDTNETGVYNYVATDSVRFYPADSDVVGNSHYGERWAGSASESLPLQGIPPRVLSEVLRDVDLFVGVCSVGNDPEWQDGGRQPNWGEYWTSYAFGALSETAKTRAAVLESLLPKLAIRKQVRVDGRFVVVEGKRNSYRIHIGSGNIQILPTNRYLCIVPGGKAAGSNVFLPFEGDRTLSIIISKALMLAKDDRIKDPSILAQL